MLAKNTLNMFTEIEKCINMTNMQKNSKYVNLSKENCIYILNYGTLKWISII